MAGNCAQTFTIVSGRGLGNGEGLVFHGVIRQRNENSDDEPMECHLWHICSCGTRGEGMGEET